MKWIIWQTINPIIVVMLVLITPLVGLWDLKFQTSYQQAWAFIDDIYKNNWLDA